MISEEKIIERIKHYIRELDLCKDDKTQHPFTVLDYKARIAELEFVLDQPKIAYQIIGGTPEAQAEIKTAIEGLIKSYKP